MCYGPFITTNLQIEIPFPEKNNNLIVCYEDDEQALNKEGISNVWGIPSMG